MNLERTMPLPSKLRGHRRTDRGIEEYVVDQARQWIGIPSDRQIEVPRPPAELVRRLLRTEENETDHRDQWGCYEFGFTESYRAGRLWVPELDAWAANWRRELSSRTHLEPLWPPGRRFVVCSTHDVDMVSRQLTTAQASRAVRAAASSMATVDSIDSRATRVARALGRAVRYGVSRSPSTLASLERSIEIERQLGVHGSYLFTVLPARPTAHDCVYDYRDPCLFRGRRTTVASVIRTLADDGVDVGLHGSYASALDERILRAEHEILSELVGRQVGSTRQHYLHFDIRRTPRAQADCGLRVDSTLGFNRNIGFRAGTSLPFRLFDLDAGHQLPVLEVPLILQESPLLDTSGLELGRAGARKVIAQMIDTVADVNGVATLLFHPHSLLNPDFADLYRFSLEYGAAQGGWMASLGEIEQWWTARGARLQGGGPSCT